MRRLQRIAWSWHASGPNGAKAGPSVLVGGAAAEADKVRIERHVAPLVFGVGIAAGGVSLPNLDQRIRGRRAGVVEHLADQLDPLAQRKMLLRVVVFGEHIMPRRAQIRPRTKLAVAGKIGAALPRQPEMEKRSGGLPGCLAGHAQFSIGVASRPRSTKSKR